MARSKIDRGGLVLALGLGLGLLALLRVRSARAGIAGTADKNAYPGDSVFFGSDDLFIQTVGDSSVDEVRDDILTIPIRYDDSFPVFDPASVIIN